MNEVTAFTTAPDAGTFQGVTAREFMRMIEDDIFDGARAELINGVIYKVAPSYLDHGSLNASVTVSLATALKASAKTVAVDLAIETNSETIFGIDIAVVNASAPRIGAMSGGSVDLAVEIASTTLAKDLHLKAAHYASVGVAAYWVVDVKARVVHVMSEPQADGYSTRDVVRFGEALAVPGTNETIVIG